MWLLAVILTLTLRLNWSAVCCVWLLIEYELMLNRYRRAWGPKPHTFIHTVKLFLTINRFYFVVSLFLLFLCWVYGMIWDVFCLVELCVFSLWNLYKKREKNQCAIDSMIKNRYLAFEFHHRSLWWIWINGR